MQIDYLAKSYTLTENINRGKRIRSLVVCGAFACELKQNEKKEYINMYNKK